MDEREKMLLELMYDDIEAILSTKQFELYNMSKYLKPKQIAQKINVDKGTVRVSLYRIRKKIGRHIELRKRQRELRGL